MNFPSVNRGAKPRIVFVSTMHGVGWGGSEELWSRTALRLLQDKRAEVCANVSYFPGSVRQLTELEAAGCPVERRTPKRLRHVVRQKIATTFGLSTTQPYLVRARPDLVVISQGAHFDGAEWMVESLHRNLRYAPIAQCFVEGHPFGDGLVDPLRAGYDGAARSFFVSAANLRDTRRQIASPIPNGKVVRNPYNVSYHAAPQWSDPSDTDGVWRLASVARLETVVKGHDVLLEALSAPQWKERPLHVTFYGKGNNEDSLKRLAQMYGLQNVTFAGMTSDVEEIWRTHHGIVLTSRWEGLPLAVVEAMLCGRISIVSDVGGNAELLTDNDTGFVAAAPRADLINDALERAWQCRDTWRERGMRAARQVRTQVPEDAIGVFADELMSLL